MSTTSSRRTKVSSHDSQDLHGSLKDKPPLPYTVGAAFTAYRHKPPAPFGHGYDSPWPPFKTGKFWLPQLDYCLSQSPLPGHTLKEYCTLAITDLIRTGYTYNAQVVVVNKTMVAKIYDPLYDNGFDCYDNKRDVIVLADGDYSREAAAYETLQRSSEARNCIPDYYGSWTIQVQTITGDKTYLRHVRLILMENVPGVVMSSIEPKLLPEATRSRIMQKILEAETFVYNAGVHHRDMSPRNVMLVSPSDIYTAPDPRVVIIDFNVSNILEINARRRGDTDLNAIHKTWPGRMVGPITRFWDELMEFEIKGWVEDDIGAANEWLWECFREREEYVPVVRDEDREECPRLVEVEELTGCVSDDDGEDDVVVFRGRGV
ncbi:AarF unusual protein kinase [Pyrenophora tritici-repentis]|uniref:EKC/KEOPS complex subunit BUD32 n=1 Tax=Pyrenophora tritici-repentis TaxID=45151 RepID=A0A2W1HAW3_9PLEO|nr:AarF unusual protein kinase [Pyrenophora tritici-repentis]KAF7452426.1 AarF unusual protein kinase [Pyrenophora tritici-repentis]KAF7574455.1 AarF, unusual protein kinase [Pyrenophora tritici-repentis]KAG9386763.1 AarF unusual protein kinase [Pyrenophora tritici-repentis]KAI0581577.1 AarF unusual protein kinase [Pyrenophora tritici-repentis]